VDRNRGAICVEMSNLLKVKTLSNFFFVIIVLQIVVSSATVVPELAENQTVTSSTLSTQEQSSGSEESTSEFTVLQVGRVLFGIFVLFAVIFFVYAIKTIFIDGDLEGIQSTILPS